MFTASQRLFVVLSGVFSTCLIVGDIIGGKLIELPLAEHRFVLTVGMIPFPVTFLLTDLLNEFYGARAARFVTLVGFGLAALAYAFILIAGALPIAAIADAPDWTGVNEVAFQNVFMGSQRMIVASLCAYMVAQLTDIAVFHALKRATESRLLWLRATGSTTLSQLVDTVVINLAAWLGVLPIEEIFTVMISSYLVKVLIAVGLTPLVYLCHSAVERLLGIEPARA